MAKEGAAVVALDVNEQQLQDLRVIMLSVLIPCPSPHNLVCAPLKCTQLHHAGILPVAVDVLETAALQELAEKLPQCDALVNCASVSSNGTVLECTEDAWDFAFDVNVKSMFLSVKTLLPLIAESGGGSIINMSSVAWDRGMPARCAYSASKAAIIGLTKSIAADFVGHQIRCNAICPGAIQTENLDQRIAQLGGDPEEVKRQFDKRAPMGRLGSLEEVGQLIVYLASDDSAYMTGTVQTIDGGAGLGGMHA